MKSSIAAEVVGTSYCARPGSILRRSLVKRIDEVDRAGPVTRALPSGESSNPDPVADRCVLGDDSGAGVLDRHGPAAEVGHLRPEGGVPVVQGRMAQVSERVFSHAAQHTGG